MEHPLPPVHKTQEAASVQPGDVQASYVYADKEGRKEGDEAETKFPPAVFSLVNPTNINPSELFSQGREVALSARASGG